MNFGFFFLLSLVDVAMTMCLCGNCVLLFFNILIYFQVVEMFLFLIL